MHYTFGLIAFLTPTYCVYEILVSYPFLLILASMFFPFVIW